MSASPPKSYEFRQSELELRCDPTRPEPCVRVTNISITTTASAQRGEWSDYGMETECTKCGRLAVPTLSGWQIRESISGARHETALRAGRSRVYFSATLTDADKKSSDVRPCQRVDLVPPKQETEACHNRTP